MKKISFCSLLFATVFISACQPKTSSVNRQEGIVLFNKDSLAHHILTLASDSLQGRRPFTLGEDRTIGYIKNTFFRLGLEAGNGASYFQDVPLVEISSDQNPTIKITSRKGNFELKKMEDYVIWTENTNDQVVSLDKAEVVFAGFGVVAPEYNWNDYAGLDVKGKVVMVMVNDPGFTTGDTTLFKGKTMTYYGRWTYKFEEAARQGAKGCLIVHNTEAASYPFNVIQNSWGSKQIHLDTRGGKEHRCPIEGWVTESAAKKLLVAAGQDSSAFIIANHRGFKALPLNLTLTTSLKVKAMYNTSHNVIAKITGTKRPEEYVLYTAHWDHFGIGRPDEKGDSIYNGALDNASGTAALLEMARVFQSLNPKPERTILFLSVTAEEQGLLGSDYYGHHPIYPLNKTVAELNMDGINPNEKTNDVVITGFGQSELEDYYMKEAKDQGRYAAPEAHPEGGHYYRSDHFSFAKVGVPALDAAAGIDVVGKGKEYGKKLQEDFVANRYHRPSDQYNATWSFEGGIQDMQLLFLVGKRLAFETSWPKWKPGSEFKSIREKSQQ